MVRLQRGTFHLEDLAGLDVGPSLLGVVLVDGGVRGGGEEVGDAFYVVVVPVGEEGVGEGDVVGGEDGGEGGEPGGFAFAGVDEEAGGAGADDVGVGALEGELGLPMSECGRERGGGVV